MGGGGGGGEEGRGEEGGDAICVMMSCNIQIEYKHVYPPSYSYRHTHNTLMTERYNLVPS